MLVLDGLRLYECAAPLALTQVHTLSLAHVATSKLFPALLRDLAARSLPCLGPPWVCARGPARCVCES